MNRHFFRCPRKNHTVLFLLFKNEKNGQTGAAAGLLLWGAVEELVPCGLAVCLRLPVWAGLGRGRAGLDWGSSGGRGPQRMPSSTEKEDNAVGYSYSAGCFVISEVRFEFVGAKSGNLH